MAVGKTLPFSALEPEVKSLVEESIAARELAYTPYSNFKVGAAILTRSGKVYSGCNVENASYGLTICAERTAIVKAVSTGDRELSAVAVAGVNKNDFLPPCGACRQFIREFTSSVDLPVYLCLPDRSNVLVVTINELLPLAFHEFSIEN